MGKSTKTSNQAVSGIVSASTAKATTSLPTSSSASKSSSSGSSKTSGSSSYGSSGSSSYGSSGTGTAYGGLSGANEYAPSAGVTKVSSVDISQQKEALGKLADTQARQAVNRINYAVKTGTDELQRAYEDTLPQYQAQQDQISADEARTKDNQVLYAEARGDRGGIGAAQYDSVQNTAAINRRAVNSARVKLYSDTSRQIADLQAQGEFEKADKLLDISQDYSDKLMDLEKWAQEQNLSAQEFNAKIDEWAAEYNLNVGKYLGSTAVGYANVSSGTGTAGTGAGVSSGTTTGTTASSGTAAGTAYGSGAGTGTSYTSGASGASGSSASGMGYGSLYGGSSTAGQIVDAMLAAGIIPTDEQLSAVGLTPQQLWARQMAAGMRS